MVQVSCQHRTGGHAVPASGAEGLVKMYFPGLRVNGIRREHARLDTGTA